MLPKVNRALQQGQHCAGEGGRLSVATNYLSRERNIGRETCTRFSREGVYEGQSTAGRYIA